MNTSLKTEISLLHTWISQLLSWGPGACKVRSIEMALAKIEGTRETVTAEEKALIETAVASGQAALAWVAAERVSRTVPVMRSELLHRGEATDGEAQVNG